MTQIAQKQLQNTPPIGRIVPTEIFLLLIGISTLGYGIINDMTMSIFWGCVIIPGVFILHHVRRKDWTKHWQEMETEHEAGIERAARRRIAAEKTERIADGGE